MKSKITGLENLKKKLDKISKKAKEDVQKAVITGALIVEGEAKKSIQQSSGTGRTYGNHTASSPGNAPRTDTGRLVSSIATEPGDLEAKVGTGLDYGKYLEFGTSVMAARPWLFPALERNKKKINKLIADAVKAALRKGSNK